MNAMTEQQAQFRTDLIDRTIADAVALVARSDRKANRALINAGIAAALPVPQTAAEASEQIDLMVNGELVALGRRDRTRYEPVMAALQTLLTSGQPITADTIRAAVA